MTRYLLDTNVVSDPSKPVPSKALEEWMCAQSGSDLFISSWTLAELWHGILRAPDGRKRDELERWYSGVAGPLHVFDGRILDFNARAAHLWAELIFQGQKLGRTRSVPDMIIASIALAHDCVVVTGNERDFWGVTVVNPFA